MKKCGHVLCKGNIMKRVKNSQRTYKIYKSVDDYIQLLLANRLIRCHLVLHSERVAAMFGSPNCALVPQLEMDMNTVEVKDGVFFRFDERGFSRVPPSSKRALVSPCAYFDYDSTMCTKANVFAQS